MGYLVEMQKNLNDTYLPTPTFKAESKKDTVVGK